MTYIVVVCCSWARISIANETGVSKILFGMALPRWIDDPTVDSQAMMQATLDFRHRHPAQWDMMQLEKQLTCIEHCHRITGETRIDPIGLKYIGCQGNDACARCREGRAGYTFRWYSLCWHDAYVAQARKGAWGLASCVADVFVNFRGQRFCSKGKLLEDYDRDDICAGRSGT